MTRFLRRVWYLLNKRRLEAELAEELAQHRALSGDPRAFGSSALAQNQARDVWLPVWLQDAAHDLRFAARLFVKERAFTLAAVAVLGLGIGVDNTMLMAVNAVCVRGLPIPGPDRVLSVGARDDRGNDINLSYREFEIIRASAPAFAGLAAHASTMASIGDDDRAADRAPLTYVSAGTFALLGERPLLGRDFTDADHQPGAPSVTILGGGLWTRRYGADAGIIGRTIRVNGMPTTVIGVIRPDFKFPRFAALWQPLERMPGLVTDLRAARTLELFGRLRDGATPGDARGAIEPVAARLARDFPEANQPSTFPIVPINERYTQKISDPSWVGFMIVGVIVLLIACANAANLLLMRSAQRAQEFAIRASLGASRARLIRQLFIECALLAGMGGAAGWALASLGGRLLTNLVPEAQMPFWIRFTMDGRMLLILSGITLASVFVFGLAPALQIARTDMNQTLKDGARMTAGGARTGTWTSALLVAEFALTVVLVTMLIKGERLARAGDRLVVEYDSTGVASGTLVLPADRYRSGGDRQQLFDQVQARLAANPAIASFAFAGALPGGGAAEVALELDGQPTAADKAPHVWMLPVGPQYFNVLGVALLRGRAFDDHDGSTGAGAAIVNQHFVDRFFAGRDPLGQRLRLAFAGRPVTSTPPWLTVAGVAPTLRQRPTPGPDPIIYVPIRVELPTSVVALARAAPGSKDAAAAAAALRDVVRAINPDLPVARLMPLDQAVGEARWAARGSTRISETVVIIAALLAALGLYAVTAHAVVLRAGEISVRRALGARSGHIVWMIWQRASIQMGLGGAIGVAGAIAWERIIGAWFVGGPPSRLVDPIDLVIVVGMVAAIGMIACIIPTWRAVQLDPRPALRRQ